MLSSTLLRITRSRALRAAARAREEVRHFSTIRRAELESRSRNSLKASAQTDSTIALTSAFISFTLVCDSNWGSGCFTLTMAVSPSRTSSPEKLASFSFSSPALRA